jgi:hypothetical protein
MEAYRLETRNILRRYFTGEITYPACVAALDAALAGLLPRLQPEDLNETKSICDANNAVLADLKRQHRRGYSPLQAH